MRLAATVAALALVAIGVCYAQLSGADIVQALGALDPSLARPVQVLKGS